ncbi:hypothetical protein [Paenibacillus sp.]|uniref:hypothetical protein n=1 Tax=Paenibacillus sp. TaxID=58172 RepID=UPI002D4A20AD|nr:hypothetical protein [Paenibacillus sp.]HZG86602.1 hypothetical protein [Paenibacillus sp.]
MDAHRDETLIERLKRYYEDYRKTSEPDSGFRDAFDALTYSVIESIGEAADRDDCATIRAIVREYGELRLSVQGSNDSVKERLEEEYQSVTR